MTNFFRRAVPVLAIVLCGLDLNAQGIKPREYGKYVKEIVKAFANDIENEFEGIHYTGSGGSMPKDVEKIDVIFVAYRNATVEEARKIEVTAIQKLVKRINEHEKIRPFLREYPFRPTRVGVSVSFRDENDERPHDGSVAYVCFAKNIIFYDAAEIRKEMSLPGSDCRDPNNIINYPSEEELVENFVDLHEETFEEAVKILSRSDNES